MNVITLNRTFETLPPFTDESRHARFARTVCHILQCKPLNPANDSSFICQIINNSTTEAWTTPVQSDAHLKLIDKLFRLYIYPIFIFVGILGNCLSCLIMFTNTRRSGYQTSLYLTLLALVDCLYLLGSALPHWTWDFLFNGEYRIENISDISCRMVYWFGNFITHLSVGLVVAVTVERFIAVQYPLMAHKLNTIKHTRLVLILLILFFFLLDSHIFIFVQQRTDSSVMITKTCSNENITIFTQKNIRCDIANKRLKQVWVYVDFTVYAFVPFLIIITLNSLIIRRLLDAQRFRQRILQFNNHTAGYECTQAQQQQQQFQCHKRHCYSQAHQALEMHEQHFRHFRRYQSLPQTTSLAVVLRPRGSQIPDRRSRYSTKQVSISTEISNISFEWKSRQQRQHNESTLLRQKPINISNHNNTRLTILLLFVSCSFLALTLPAVVLNLIMSTDSKLATLLNSKPTHRNLYHTLARLSMIGNHSINFLLYFVLGKRFRRDLKRLFISIWRKLCRGERRRKWKE